MKQTPYNDLILWHVCNGSTPHIRGIAARLFDRRMADRRTMGEHFRPYVVECPWLLDQKDRSDAQSFAPCLSLSAVSN